MDKRLSREGEVDLLRAIGIVLMIMGHVKFGPLFDRWIHAFHMPLWFIITGYFCNVSRDTKPYIIKKVKTILIPYISFSLIYEVLSSFKGDNRWLGIVFPNSYQVPYNGALWFLPALFAVSVIGFLLFKYIPVFAPIILIVLAAVGSMNLVKLPFSLDSAMVGCGFFLIGYALRKYGKVLLNVNLPISIAVFAAFSYLSCLIGTVNMRANEYQVIPLFWINAALLVISLWNMLRVVNRFDNAIMTLIKKIGADSLIYVCLNQYILKCLKGIPVLGHCKLLTWKFTEVLLIIAVCFVINRILSKTPLKFMLGK